MTLVDYDSPTSSESDNEIENKHVHRNNEKVDDDILSRQIASSSSSSASLSVPNPASTSLATHSTTNTGVTYYPKEQKSASQGNKRKQLPTLPTNFNPTHVDDPTLHQGRKRTRPFVDGEYTAHIYINLSLPPAFRTSLEGLLACFPASRYAQPLHALFATATSSSTSNANDGTGGLHISLSHPLALRRSQIQAFRNDLSNRLRSDAGVRPFRLSLAGRTKLYYNTMRSSSSVEYGGQLNGGRAFLALRVGAGAVELKHILDKVIHPLLDIYHLPTYHSSPEFHTSFAWTLLDSPDTDSKSLIDDHIGEIGLDGNKPTFVEEEGRPKPTSSSAVLPPYGGSELNRINDRFENHLISSQPANGWEIGAVHVKVAKEIMVVKL